MPFRAEDLLAEDLLAEDLLAEDLLTKHPMPVDSFSPRPANSEISTIEIISITPNLCGRGAGGEGNSAEKFLARQLH